MANHFGKPINAYLSNEFNPKQNSDRSFEATDSYVAPYSTIQSILVDLLGSNHTRAGWEFLRVTAWEVEPNKSDLCKLKVTLKSPSNEGDFDYDDSDASKYTYELAISTSEDPIETHYRYRNVVKEEKDTIQYLKLGSYKFNTAQSTEESFVFDNVNGNESDKGDPRKIESAGGIELATYIMKGILTYRRSRQIWREKWVDFKLPQASLLNLVGHIATAHGIPTLSEGRNTLLNGLNSSQQGDIFNNVAEYEVSGRGGWDPKLYRHNEPDPT